MSEPAPPLRTCVVTGSSSGIGLATASLLAERGHTVIGTDLHGSDIDADLSTACGRDALTDGVRRRTAGRIDAVVACAGIPGRDWSTVQVNYLGTVGVLAGLRPYLAGAPAPRAVVVSSSAAVRQVDVPLLEALHDDDTAGARARVHELLEAGAPPRILYATSKRALNRWVRRAAPSAAWAGNHIALNAVAPGAVRTAMTESMTRDPAARQRLLERNPMPLNGIADPEDVARLLAWLVGVENTHLCGQILYADGGSETLARGDSTW